MNLASVRRRLMHNKLVLLAAGVAVALMLIGVLLRARPVAWSRLLGDFLPGWPWS